MVVPPGSPPPPPRSRDTPPEPPPRPRGTPGPIPLFPYNEMRDVAGQDPVARVLVEMTAHLTDLVVWAVKELRR